MPSPHRKGLAGLTESKLFGRIEIIYWLGGEKNPLTGSHAVEVLTRALVDVIKEMEPIRPHVNGPVIDRVDRIHKRVHKAVEDEFQRRWHRHEFER